MTLHVIHGEKPVDHFADAQAAAEQRLAACEAALDAESVDEGDGAKWPDDLEAPYCGCDTCIVREILSAAWPHLVKAVHRETKEEAS